MPTNLTQLYNCRTCVEAQPILETVKARPSARKLVETAIALKASPDPKQQQYANEFLATAIKEMEDDEKKLHEQEDDDKLKIKKGDTEPGTHETDTITGALDSHQSSNIEGVEQQGTDAPQSNIEDVSSQTGLHGGEGTITEGMPGYPPTGQMPPGPTQAAGPPAMPGMMPGGMDPAVAQQMQMQNKMPQVPPMNTPQQMQQMRYTIQQTLKPYFETLKKHEKAIVSLGKMVKETQDKKASMQLDLDKIHNEHQSKILRETQGGPANFIQPGVPMPPTTKFPRLQLEKKRSEIASIDRTLSQGNMYA